MLRWRAWHIFFFVLLSMLVAVLYSKYFPENEKNIPRSVASENEIFPDVTPRSVLSPSSSSQTWRDTFHGAAHVAERAVGRDDEGNENQLCQCLAAGVDSQMLQFENIESCTGSRRAEILKLPQLYRSSRTTQSSELPRACFLAEMKQWPAEFGCVTEARVNAIANFYRDLFSCLELPLREAFPLWALRTETRLKENRSSLAKPPTISPAFLKEIESRDNPACRRLQPTVAQWGLSELGFEAEFVKSLWQTEKDLRFEFQKSKYAIEPGKTHSLHGLIRLSRWAWGESNEDFLQLVEENLHTQSLLLAFEIGPETATDLLAQYLLLKLKRGDVLQKVDFDFSQQTGWPEFLSQNLPRHVRGDGQTLWHQMQFALNLSRILKNNTCVPESFLKF